MNALLLQYTIGGVLLLLLVLVKGHDFRRLVHLVIDRRRMGTAAWLRALVDLAIAAVLMTAAVDLFVDPLVAGVAQLEIHAPATPATTSDHLLVRTVPVGPFGPAGGGRIVLGEFDARGVAILNVPLERLESRVIVDILDTSLPNAVVERRSVYVSPFVRRTLWPQVVNFVEQEESMTSAHSARGLLVLAVVAIGFAVVVSGSALKITYPADNAHVSGKVIELTGTGADPMGQLEVSVFTDNNYVQNGKAIVHGDGSWSYAPVYLSGQGEFNNHTIRVTIISNGKRLSSATVRGIVRRD